MAVPQIIANTTISGVEDEAEDNVKLMLSLHKEKCDTPKWKIQGLFEDADQEIDHALQALGYYHAAIKKSLVFNKDCWKADFNINPGQRVLVSAVDIVINGDAKDDPAFSDLLKKMPLKQSSPLHHGQYETMKGKIKSLALESGYLQGSFTKKTAYRQAKQHCTNQTDI